MIKTESEHLQDIFQSEEVEVSSERREQLARKGQALYGKYCGTKGRGICAESFVEYHMWRGEFAVARDFLEFQRTQLEVLRQSPDEGNQLPITEQLISRIEELLGETVSP